MKIVSFMAAATVAVMMTLVGCGDGPGKTPETTTPPDTDETPVPPAPTMHEFSGTFTFEPDATNPLMGTITATITGISQDDTAVTDPAALAAVIQQFGGDSQTFNYELSQDMTSITLTGELLMKLMLPGGMVSATRSGAPGMDLATALLGTWMTEVTDPETMATTTLTLVITAPTNFTLTLTTAPPSS